MLELISSETVIAVEDTDCYTEVYVTQDGRIQLHIEDGETGTQPVFDLDQAKRLMTALGRAIWVIENDDYREPA